MQRLVIYGITERIDMGSNDYSCHSTYLPADDIEVGATYVAYQCEGQPNPDDADDTVSLEWTFTVDRLDDDTMEFTFDGRHYTLDRHWQVLGTPSYGIPNAYVSKSIRFILFFETPDEGNMLDFTRLGRLGSEMAANGAAGELWKNIPLARKAMHILKDRKHCCNEEKAKEFCKQVLSTPLLDDKEVPRLYLSFLDYYHVLWRSTYYDDNCTYHLLQALDPDIDDDTFLANERGYRSLAFDPVQRTPQWEAVIYDVERQVDEQLRGQPRHMGFCHLYWATKRQVLEEHGIQWRSPSAMNPKVMFD